MLRKYFICIFQSKFYYLFLEIQFLNYSQWILYGKSQRRTPNCVCVLWVNKTTNQPIYFKKMLVCSRIPYSCRHHAYQSLGHSTVTDARTAVTLTRPRTPRTNWASPDPLRASDQLPDVPETAIWPLQKRLLSTLSPRYWVARAVWRVIRVFARVIVITKLLKHHEPPRFFTNWTRMCHVFSGQYFLDGERFGDGHYLTVDLAQFTLPCVQGTCDLVLLRQ